MRELNLQCLYKVYQEPEKFIYFFETDTGTKYRIAFEDISKEFPLYNLSIEKLYGVKIFDNQVKETIVAICKYFFINNENSIFYLCDISDDKQKARQKLFHKWFLSDVFHKELVKMDNVISVDDEVYFISMICHKNNSNLWLITDFYNQNITELKNK